MNELLALVTAYFNDDRTLALLGLILADLLTGVAAALKTRTFAWPNVADFLYTNVLPYVFGNLLVYLVAYFNLASALGPAMADIVSTLGSGAAGVALLGSIMANLSQLRTPTPPRHEISIETARSIAVERAQE